MSRSSSRAFYALGTILLAGAATTLGFDIAVVTPEPDVAKIQTDTSTQSKELTWIDTSGRGISQRAVLVDDAGARTTIRDDLFCDPIKDSDIGTDVTITRIGNVDLLGTCTPDQIAERVYGYKTSALPEGGLRFGFVLLAVGAAASIKRGFDDAEDTHLAKRTTAPATLPTPARTITHPAPKPLPTTVGRPGHVVRAADRASVIRQHAERLMSSERAQTLDAWQQATVRTLSGTDLDDAVRYYTEATGEGTGKKIQRLADTALNEQLLRIETEIGKLDEIAQQRMLERQRVHSTYLDDKFRKSSLDL